MTAAALRRTFTLVTVGILAARAASAQVDPRLYAGLSWRNLGPFRAGRVSAVSGVIGDPGTFYAGYPGGGLWKTTSAGQVWYPVFDAIKEISSVGAVEVAPSDPNVVYVGTGDMITGGTLDQGNGVYKSADGGASWQHLGLAATRHIQTMLVDPRNPDVVLVGALGDHIHASPERGVFRSTDGGRTWTRTLAIDDSTGIAKLARAFDVPDVIFATSMRHWTPPGYAVGKYRSWQFGTAVRPSPDTGRSGTAIYQSRDGGVTWAELPGEGLPRLMGRTSLAVAIGTGAQRLYLITDGGLYRSDDGGLHWRRMAADDPRIRNGQGGYSAGVYVDPKNPDLVYTINTASYRSTDGGATFTGMFGAPGGDDPQQLWIDPTNGRRMLMGLDQGATVSLDGGETWSGWYNQSTDQLYHLAADNSWPYWIYAAQQDAGAIRTRSRGNYGAVSIFDWNPVGGWEWGTIVPDPRDPNIVFASGSGIQRISYPTEQIIDVSPALDPAVKVRTTPSMPLIWAPWNQRLLLAGFNAVYGTTDGGSQWTRMSPDLGKPAGMDSAAGAKRLGGYGAIESMVASTVAPGEIWVGTDNGMIQMTRDTGRTWHDVSIPDLPNPRVANVSSVELSTGRRGRRTPQWIPPERRSPALPLPDPRPGPDLDGHRRRPAGGRAEREFRAGAAGGSGGAGAAVRRDREQHLRLLRRRRPLAVARPRSPEHAGARPHGQGQRPGDRHPWPRALGHRRHLDVAGAAAAGRRGGGGAGVAVRPGHGHPGAAERQPGHSPAPGNSPRRQPPRRSDHRLLAQRAGGQRHDRHPRRGGCGGPAFPRHDRRDRGRVGEAVLSELLGGRAARLADRCGRAPGELGPAIRSTSRVRAFLRDQRQPGRDAALARGTAGGAGDLHHPAPGRDGDANPDGDGAERPAVDRAGRRGPAAGGVPAADQCRHAERVGRRTAGDRVADRRHQRGGGRGIRRRAARPRRAERGHRFRRGRAARAGETRGRGDGPHLPEHQRRLRRDVERAGQRRLRPDGRDAGAVRGAVPRPGERARRLAPRAGGQRAGGECRAGGARCGTAPGAGGASRSRVPVTRSSAAPCFLTCSRPASGSQSVARPLAASRPPPKPARPLPIPVEPMTGARS